jgi:hypothetical protein
MKSRMFFSKRYARKLDPSLVNDFVTGSLVIALALGTCYPNAYEHGILREGHSP